MHQYLINASIQLLPIQSGEQHPYAWVDQVVALIEAAGLSYEVGPFSTSVVADYKSIMKLIDTINESLVVSKCPEWILSVQLQLRSDSDMTADEKLEQYK